MWRKRWVRLGRQCLYESSAVYKNIREGFSFPENPSRSRGKGKNTIKIRVFSAINIDFYA